MARIIYSALVESIRGSIKGTTFQRNAYGYTVKGKPNMVNPNSIRQNRSRLRFSRATQAWRDLSGANRANWNTYANTFPIPSRKNPASYLNGLNAFTRYHSVWFLSQSSVLANPSGVQGTAVVNQIDIDLSGGVLSLLLEIITTNGPWRAEVSMSRPLNATQAFVKSWTRNITSATSATWADFVITTEYQNVFGFLPALGALIGVQVTMINTTNGQVLFGAPTIITVTT